MYIKKDGYELHSTEEITLKALFSRLYVGSALLLTPILSLVANISIISGAITLLPIVYKQLYIEIFLNSNVLSTKRN